MKNNIRYLNRRYNRGIITKLVSVIKDKLKTGRYGKLRNGRFLSNLWQI